MSYIGKLYEVRFPAEEANSMNGEAIPEEVVCIVAPNVSQAIEQARRQLTRGEWRPATACQLIRERVVVA